MNNSRDIANNQIGIQVFFFRFGSLKIAAEFIHNPIRHSKMFVFLPIQGKTMQRQAGPETEEAYPIYL